MKLRTKIQLFSSIFMLILLLLINTSIYALFFKISINSELSYLSNHTNTIVTTLHSNPDIPRNELLNAFLPQHGMIRIISEAEERPLLTLTKDNSYRDLPIKFNRQEVSKTLKTEENVNIAVISKPVIWDDGEVVMLEVSDHLYSLKETMTTLFYVLFVAGLFMFIPTLIAGALLGRFILQPIKTLTSTMKENMRQDQWKKIDLINRSHDELYEMEKTFNDMIDELKENFEKQETFVSNASHELKTPIAIVKSYAQLLKRRGKEHPQVFDESVGAIDSEADRMQTLVEQLLLLAKSENPVLYEKINLIDICNEIVKKFSNASDRTIHFHTQLTSVFVHGNSDQLKQVLYILIDNGFKYSDEDINLNIFELDESAIIQVIDFGQGIPEDELPLIFDRFYRLDKARSRETGGTGLGLSIAQTIANAHHGSISISSEVGKGSTFTFKLPLFKENENK